MTRTGDKSGFRLGDPWDSYAKIVGNAGRSADLRRYLEWRIDNPVSVLGTDPGADGARVRKFRVHEDLWKPYAHIFIEDERKISADIRAYIAWRIAHPDLPLPGNTRVSFRLNRQTASS